MSEPSGYSSDEYNEEPERPQLVVPRTNLPPEALSPKIKITKGWIAILLQKPNDSNLDSTIQEQMTANKIDYNPNEPNLQTRLDQLTRLKEKLEQAKLEQAKKGGKKQKSKRYRKSRKQRKTKTKRRLRRSYKYK
jgi:hypothetical protein